MALIKCEMYPLDMKDRWSYMTWILRLIRETTSVLSEKMVPEKYTCKESFGTEECG